MSAQFWGISKSSYSTFRGGERKSCTPEGQAMRSQLLTVMLSLFPSECQSDHLLIQGEQCGAWQKCPRARGELTVCGCSWVPPHQAKPSSRSGVSFPCALQSQAFLPQLWNSWHRLGHEQWRSRQSDQIHHPQWGGPARHGSEPDCAMRCGVTQETLDM